MATIIHHTKALQNFSKKILGLEMKLDLTPDEVQGRVSVRRKVPLSLAEFLKFNTIVLAQGVEIESRPYTAHITLARNLKKRPELEVVPPIQWQSDSFVLVHSVSTARGVDYQVINTWPLVAK